MLVTTFTGSKFDPSGHSELVTLKTNVDRCIRLKNSNSFTNDDVGAGNNLFCTGTSGDDPLSLFRQVDAVSFLFEDIDKQLLFDVARTVMRQWRVMGMAGSLDRNEVEMRRLAAHKLTEVGALSPDAAILQMSGAAREETDNSVLLALIDGLAQLITPTTSDNIRTEAITTLKILAANPDPPVAKSAQVALEITDVAHGKPIDLDLTPPPPPPVKKPLPGYVVPVVAIAGTAIVATGVLWYIFGHRSSTHALSAPGPLRRRAEAQLRRRQSAR